MKKLIELYKDNLREGLNKYTRKAYLMLPELDKPRILDIGCGSGVPTMELARLSNGQIVGLEIDQALLNKLMRKIEKAGLSDRIKTVRCSMFELDFPDESFDIIWSEGSIFKIGFEKGLKEWKRFLKPNGFLVVHDEITNTKKKLKYIPSCGYKLLGHFLISEYIWWAEYYNPLEKRINDVRKKYINDSRALLELDNEQQEIDMFKKNPKSNRSIFYIMQKK